jgi:hypothetical protein
MYILNDLVKATQDEKLRVAARHQRRHQVYAARRAESRSGSARQLADLRILHVLRGRRAAQAY